jgi:hypothetical protein
MTLNMNSITLVSRGGARLLRSLPGWRLSAKGTSLYRRVGRGHVSVYTKPGRGSRFFVKVEIPIDADDEEDVVRQALAMAQRALDTTA